jgi:antitoxin (DNA-binding transcriptional repressor) of toxin-antitoxin stability system
MRRIGAFEAKNTLGSLLDLVERGEEIVITRRGRPVARLVREPAGQARSAAAAAAARIRAMARRLELGRFDGDEWKAMRDEGRRWSHPARHAATNARAAAATCCGGSPGR